MTRTPPPFSSPGPADATALLVLGMHRSGTSVLTRVLNLLGAAVPKNLYPALESNPKGHWESQDLIDAHEGFLKALGLAHDDPAPLPADWLTRPEAASLEAAAVKVLTRDLADQQLIVLKDPRMCRLVPLWHRLLHRQGYTPRYILPIRHPLEVAASLARRNGYDEGRSVRLWLRHFIEAERDTRGRARAFLTYAGLLADWRGTIATLADTLGLVWPVPVETAATAIEAEITPDLKHHTAEAEDRLAAIDPDAARAYQAARALCRNPQDQDALATLAAIDRRLRQTDRPVRPLDWQPVAAPEASSRLPLKWSLKTILRRALFRLRHRAALRHRPLLEQAALFDAAYYRGAYADVGQSGLDPMDHFLAIGGREGRRPNAVFDPAWYDWMHLAPADRPDHDGIAMPVVRDRPLGPLSDYIENAATCGRNPNPLFDRAVYALQTGVLQYEPMADFLQRGLHIGLNPYPVLGALLCPWPLTEGVQRFHHLLAHLAHIPTYAEAAPLLAAYLQPAWGDTPATAHRTPPRIALFLHSGARTGGSLLLLELAQRLAAAGAQIVTVFLAQGPVVEDFAALGPAIDLVVLSHAHKNRLDAAEALAADLVAALECDVLIANTLIAASFAAACAARGVPVLSSLHEHSHSIRAFMDPDAVTGLDLVSRHILADSEALKQDLCASFGLEADRVTVLHNGVLHSRRAPMDRAAARAEVRAAFGLGPADRLVACSGTLDFRKGADLIVRLAQLDPVPGAPHLSFVWVGGSPDAVRWYRYLSEIEGLGDRVRWVGEVADPRAYLAAADLFALPSREDPFPLVVLEAMAMGLPVVAFNRLGGAPEAIGSDAGIVVPAYDLAAYRAALVKLAADDELRAQMGAVGRRKVETRFTFDRLEDGVRQILHRDFGVTL